MDKDRIFLLVCATVFAFVAAYATPAELIDVGLMDVSLTSEVELTRRTAYLEVVLGRGFLVVLGIGFLVGGLYWPRIKGTDRFSRFMRDDSQFRRGDATSLGRFISAPSAVLFGVLLIVLAFIRFGGDVFSPAQVVWVAREDGLIETASAFMLLGASGLSAWVAFRLGRGQKRFGMYVFLAVLFFVMLGEEVSWGQRYFDLAAPEVLIEINVQNEMNLHNIGGYLFDHLFILLFFLWGAVVPLIYHLVPIVRQAVLRMGLPVASAGLALGALAITLMQNPVVYSVIPPLPGLRLAEAREFLSEMFFLLLMVESARQFAAARGEGLSRPEAPGRVGRVLARYTE